MLESLIIMLREGIEASLVIGIVLVVLKRTQRRDLERAALTGVAVAIGASLLAALALNRLPINEEAYEGVLYFVSAAFVASMTWWMHRNARALRGKIEERVGASIAGGSRGAWALGAFTFLMIFREGAETVMFLSAVSLTTDALLSFIGSLLGLAGAVVFCVLFIRGSLHVNMRRFFVVTEWVLGIFIVQLVVNGYHEFSEFGLLPATQKTMAIIGPLVRNNALFLLAIVAIPLLILLSGGRAPEGEEKGLSDAQQRLARARRRRDLAYRISATVATLVVLVAVGISYAKERVPQGIPAPAQATLEGDEAVVALAELDDGELHRIGVLVNGSVVRFIAMKTDDGKPRVALDACEICGSFGYIQDGRNLLCLNCAASINPLTMGASGGCNPIPVTSRVENGTLRIPMSELSDAASIFADVSGAAYDDPVCGMQIKVASAVAFETFNGAAYYFCSEHCHEQFKADPAKYAVQ